MASINGSMISGSHARKRQYPDGTSLEHAPVDKRPARRELPSNMPPEFARSYRQKQELLERMFLDSRKLMQMESINSKNSTCKYGNIYTGYTPDLEKAAATPTPNAGLSFSLSCTRSQWFMALRGKMHYNMKKELREYAAQYLSHVDPHGKYPFAQPKPAEHPEYPSMQHKTARSQLLPDHVSTAHHVDPSAMPYVRRDDSMYGKMPLGSMSRHSSRETMGQGMGAPMGAHHRQSSLGYSAQFALP